MDNREDMKLVIPSEDLLEAIEEYRIASLKDSDTIYGSSSLGSHEDLNKWLVNVKDYSEGNNLPSDFVRADQYVFLRGDNKIVGMLNFRRELNEVLLQSGGHIGYSIHPDERRKGYADLMLRTFLNQIDVNEYERVLLTCDERNAGSRSVIVNNGGVYENTIIDPEDGSNMERYWIELKHL